MGDHIAKLRANIGAPAAHAGICARAVDPNCIACAIVKGVVGLAEALGLNVVAEGVETAEQWAFLRESGCHTLQGYYIARPLTVEALEQWLRDRAP